MICQEIQGEGGGVAQGGDVDWLRAPAQWGCDQASQGQQSRAQEVQQVTSHDASDIW